MIRAEETGIRGCVVVGLERGLGGLVRRVLYKVVLSRRVVVSYLTEQLVVQWGVLCLGWQLARLAKAPVVDVRVGRLVRVGGNATQGRLL